MEVIAPICEKLDTDQITKYIQGWLCEMYDSPDLKEFYPDDTQDDEHEDEQMEAAIKNSNYQKRLSI